MDYIYYFVCNIAQVIVPYSVQIAVLLLVSKYAYNLLKDKIKNKYLLGLASVAIADTAAIIMGTVVREIVYLITWGSFYSIYMGLWVVPILGRIYGFFVSNPLENLVYLFINFDYFFNFISSATCLIIETIFYIVFFAVIIMSFNPKTEKSKDGNKRQDKKQPSLSDLDEIKKYKQLLDANAISQEEFDTKKKQLLGQ